MQPTEYKHIVLDEDGLATIEGTRTKVFQILAEHYFHGWTPEEIHWQHPYLGLSQIHAAFAFYYEHQAHIDSQIQADGDLSQASQSEHRENCPVRTKLRAIGQAS